MRWECVFFAISQNYVRIRGLNTGIAISFDIGTALDLIRQHPIGPMVSHDFEMK